MNSSQFYVWKQGFFGGGEVYGAGPQPGEWSCSCRVEEVPCASTAFVWTQRFGFQVEAVLLLKEIYVALLLKEQSAPTFLRADMSYNGYELYKIAWYGG